MDQVEKEYNGAVKVVKVEHDANPKLIADYKVCVRSSVQDFGNLLHLV